MRGRRKLDLLKEAVLTRYRGTSQNNWGSFPSYAFLACLVAAVRPARTSGCLGGVGGGDREIVHRAATVAYPGVLWRKLRDSSDNQMGTQGFFGVLPGHIEPHHRRRRYEQYDDQDDGQGLPGSSRPGQGCQFTEPEQVAVGCPGKVSRFWHIWHGWAFLSWLDASFCNRYVDYHCPAFDLFCGDSALLDVPVGCSPGDALTGGVVADMDKWLDL